MTDYNEITDGDLSSNSATPTFLDLTAGNNRISGSTQGGGNPPTDPDFFTFTVPVAFTASQIILENYSGASNSYFAVTAGNSFPSLVDDSTYEVSKLIDTDQLTQDLLEPGVGDLPLGSSPAGSGSLAPGTYSVWYQETGANTSYTFNVVLTPVLIPPPASTPGDIQFSANTFDVNEEAGTIDITLTRTGGSDGAVSVELRSIAGGTAEEGADYSFATSPPVTVNFADGQTEQTVSVAIANDVIVEGNETALFELSNPTGGASLGTTTQTTLTIIDSDEIFTGTDGSDILVGGVGDDRILGGSNDDRLIGNDGNDRLLGGSADDRLFGGNGNDRLVGGSGDDRLAGNDGNDVLVGGGGDDRLLGGAGNDRLLGGSSDDVMDGGLGADTIIGGAGRDSFVLRRNNGLDLIRDFEIDEDSLDLRGIRRGALTFTQNGNRAVIRVGDDQLAILQGVRVNQLNADQFS